MKIIKVRYGHATNSSSMHSLIIDKDKTIKGYDTEEYGWDEFVLSNRYEKIKYLCVQVFMNVSKMYFDKTHEDLEKSKELCLRIFDKDYSNVQRAFDEITEESYIDHQSVLSLPINIRTGEICLEFVRDLFVPILQEEVTILGGNDNSEHSIKDVTLLEMKEIFYLLKDSRKFYLREEKFGYVLFSLEYGTKTKISYNLDNIEIDYPKEYAPELVDLCITHKCTQNCSFCYQNSLEDGKHAEQYKILGILRELKDAGVFEIALGGGEPTEHPHFFDILEECNRLNISVNFSTKNYDFISVPCLFNKISQLVGSIGVSVASLEELKTFKSKFKEYPSNIILQVIPELFTKEEMKEFLEFAKNERFYRVLFLGYKECGRATKVKKANYNFISLANGMHVSVDTVICKRYPKYLKNIDTKRYELAEGKISKYIDAVDMTIAKSSYEGEKHKFGIYDNLHELLEKEI